MIKTNDAYTRAYARLKYLHSEQVILNYDVRVADLPTGLRIEICFLKQQPRTV